MSCWQTTTLATAVSAALSLHIRSFLGPNDTAAATTAGRSLGADHHFPALDYRSSELPLDKALALTDHAGDGGGDIEAARRLIAAGVVFVDGVVATDRAQLVGPRSVLSLREDDGGGLSGHSTHADDASAQGDGLDAASSAHTPSMGRPLRRQPLVYYLLNKPRKVMVTTRLGPHDRSAPTMLEYVPRF